MEKELALLIADLESGLDQTDRAEDRKLFEACLAQAALLVSKVILDVPKEELFAAIDAYERLWGNTWLQGSWVKKYPDSYNRFKTLAGYRGFEKA